MTWAKIIYNTIWFRCHPITGPIAPDDPMPVTYPSWRAAWDVARIIARVKFGVGAGAIDD